MLRRVSDWCAADRNPRDATALGPDLYGGVCRAINLCDQYDQLVVLRIPRRVADGDADANSMPLTDFEELLEHIEHRGLDVATPSDVVDVTMG